MRDRINTLLDITIKTLSLLFTICIFIGAWVTWSYLNKVGLGNEISSIVSTPQVLFTIALYSLFLSIGAISIFIFVPAIISYCDKGDEFNWKNKTRENIIINHFLLIFVPLLVFISLTTLVSEYINLTTSFFSTCLVATIYHYTINGGPKLINKKNEIKHFTLLFTAITISYTFLLFSFIFFLKITAFLDKGEITQWLSLLFIFFIYSASAAFASSSSKLALYTPLIIISFVMLLILFADKGSANVIAKLGVGSYTSSYSIDAKHLIAIKSNDSFKIKDTEDDSVLILNDVWVVVALPKKIILSPSKSSRLKYSIPTTAILSEISATNKKAKIL